ncbi:MAG: hypothetical protein CVT49_01410 [candidate division Zixibacteria bacterium HGW-Zixibacteria-1]|nr:MAG: hypothetical protein CVT49_01410 [candidate division Zixibacteria bacterium HGW-Zixibacteria-1]
MNLSITILGSGSGNPSAERSSSGYVLEYNGRLLLFDCGSGVSSSFVRSAFEPAKVDAIFISHMHPDHVSDLPVFIQLLYLADRLEPLTVYLPAEAVKPVKKYLNACYLFDEKLPFKLELKAIDAPVTVLGREVEVKPIVNLHLMTNSEIIEATEYPNKMECYSYLVKIGGKKLLYTADIVSIDEMENYLEKLDLLITETTHVDTDQLPSLIEKKQIAKVVLSHIGDDKISEMLKFAGAQAAGGKIIVGKDNLTIKI